MVEFTGIKNLIIVGLGGFLGAIARYKLGGLILHHSGSIKFPLGTFIVNIAGCLTIGLIGGLIEKHHIFGGEMRLLIFTGFLGGFTTFSAFGYETVFLARRGDEIIALINIGATIIGGITAVWFGIKIGTIGGIQK